MLYIPRMIQFLSLYSYDRPHMADAGYSPNNIALQIGIVYRTRAGVYTTNFCSAISHDTVAHVKLDAEVLTSMNDMP